MRLFTDGFLEALKRYDMSFIQRSINISERIYGF